MPTPKKSPEARALARASLANKKPVKAKATRNAQGHFIKGGVPGNPGGRRNGVLAHAHLIQRETENGTELVDFMLSVLRGEFSETRKDGTPGLNAGELTDSEKFKARLWACEKLHDRGFGKAKETIEVITSDLDTGGSAGQIDMSKATDEELEALTKAGDIFERLTSAGGVIDV